MRFAKLIDTLKQFSPPEIKWLSLYIQSPYFKTPEQAVALFEYLQSLPRSYPEKKLSLQSIAASCPLLKNESIQAQAATALRKSITHFVSLETAEQNEFEPSINYLRAFKKQHLFNDFEEVYEQTQKQLNAQPNQDAEVFYYRHRLEEIKFNGYDAKLNRTRKNDIAPVLDSLDVFYAIHKLRYACEAVHRKQWFGIENKPQQLEPLLAILQPYTNLQYPYVYLFVQVYQMLTASDYSEGLKHYRPIREYTERLPVKKRWNVPVIEAANYTYNFCVQWYNRGYAEYGKEYLWWVEQMLEQKLLLDKNKMQPILFRNILTVAARVDYPAAWLKNFITKYTPSLPTDKRQPNLAYAEGLYYYVQKDFVEAGARFSQSAILTDPLHNCIVKRWNFICQYESRKNQDGLDTLLAAYRKYINEHREDLHQFKTVFDKFIAYAQKLLTAPDKHQKKKIADALNKEEFFPAKDWLLQQLK